MKVSVIIPVFNEERVIRECLDSLLDQNFKDIEIIIVDDGSKDDTVNIVKQYPIKLLKQQHLGPGVARNFGAKGAIGNILVFVDADMTFDKEFISKLVDPIIKGEVIGTFSKEEYVSNKDNVWSKCWNINKGIPINRMHGSSYPNEQKVFRAILKREFDKTDGFEPIGYIDDHTISDQLGILAKTAPGAVFYHKNPDNLEEVFKQARWIGKSEFKNRKIKNENLMKLVTMVRYSLPLSLINGVLKVVRSGLPQFIVFKIIYDLAIEISVIGSYFGEQAYR